MINDILTALDLEEIEVKAYLTLLENGAMPGSTLGKKLGIPRSSGYAILQSLIEKGLVNQSIYQSKKHFAAENLQKVNLLFEQKVQTLQDKQRLFKKVLPSLQKKLPTKFLTPIFQIFEGKDGLQQLIKDVFLYHDMETQSFWPIKKMLDVLTPDFFLYMNKERIKNNLSIRAIWPADQIPDIKQHPYLGDGEKFKRQIKIAPAGTDFSMGNWIYGNKVAFISSEKESTGFIIESAELAEMQLAQFNIMWGASKPFHPNPVDSEAFAKEL